MKNKSNNSTDEEEEEEEKKGVHGQLVEHQPEVHLRPSLGRVTECKGAFPRSGFKGHEALRCEARLLGQTVVANLKNLGLDSAS